MMTQKANGLSEAAVLMDGLRESLVSALIRHGFIQINNQLTPPDSKSKDDIRRLYDQLRRERIQRAGRWLLAGERKLLPYFAEGTEVKVEMIRPSLIPVDTQRRADLFRYASLLWSIPVSAGYGRRMRFLVFDESNGKLIGLFALGDPVYNLQVRDQWIKWGVEEKNERLYHVMDAYVLGAVPQLKVLCGNPT